MVVAETGIVHFLDLRAGQVASTGVPSSWVAEGSWVPRTMTCRQRRLAMQDIHEQLHSGRPQCRVPPRELRLAGD